MRRAFIRLFGCVLSAIGLGVSYDTTMTVVLGDKAAPGAAWAASECYFNSGCVPDALSGADNLKMTGQCTGNGSNIVYNVVLAPWYVGWLNHNYKNGSNPMTGVWPLIYGDENQISAMNLGFSGEKISAFISGFFVGTSRNVKGTAGDVLELCNNDAYASGAHLGLSTGFGDNPSALSFRSSCVMNRDEVGGFSYENLSEGTKKYGAVYLYRPDPFINAGCCEYSGSTSSSTSCKCFYAPATTGYGYQYYEAASYSKPAGWRSASTVTFYEPFVLYFFEGCQTGYYKEKQLELESANFALNLLSYGAYAGLISNSYIEDLCAYKQVAVSTPSDENASRNYENIWDVCQKCGEMTELYLQNRYVPTISSWGKAEPVASVAGTGDSTCRVKVSDVEDEIGIYNFTQSCTPTY